MGLLSTGITDIGMKRKTNQDTIFLDSLHNLFIVADGMGGHNGGDTASALATQHIPQYIIKNIASDPVQIINDGIELANKIIQEEASKNPELEGMGTTVVTFLFKGSSLYIGNVGDSRGYLINKGNLYQLTKDHSLVQEKLNMGIYNREQAAKDPKKNVLVRTVGFDTTAEVDVFQYKVSKNDLFINCSDGLHAKVSDADILFLVNKYIPFPENATQDSVKKLTQALLDQANENGGNDNISVIVIVAQ